MGKYVSEKTRKLRFFLNGKILKLYFFMYSKRGETVENNKEKIDKNKNN